MLSNIVFLPNAANGNSISKAGWFYRTAKIMCNTKRTLSESIENLSVTLIRQSVATGSLQKPPIQFIAPYILSRISQEIFFTVTKSTALVNATPLHQIQKFASHHQVFQITKSPEFRTQRRLNFLRNSFLKIQTIFDFDQKKASYVRAYPCKVHIKQTYHKITLQLFQLETLETDGVFTSIYAQAVVGTSIPGKTLECYVINYTT